MHPFDRNFGPIGSYPQHELPIGSRCAEDRIFGGVRIPYNCRYRLGFHHAQLVMNRHFFGTQHGLPLNAISGHVTRISPSGFTVRQSWRAQVIVDELFLSATHVISHSGKNTGPTERSHDTDFDIFPHIRTTFSWPGHLETPVFECREGDPLRMDSYLKVVVLSIVKLVGHTRTASQSMISLSKLSAGKHRSILPPITNSAVVDHQMTGNGRFL